MTPIHKRFLEEKKARIWSDWCSSGVWDDHGVNVDARWLPISYYASALLVCMQTMYDYRPSGAGDDVVDSPYDDEHFKEYEELRERARTQIAKELPDWEIR